MFINDKAIRKETVQNYLLQRGIISADDQVQKVRHLRSDESSLLYVLTEFNSLVLKQQTRSAGTREFLSAEFQFYHLVQGYPYLSRFMPTVYQLDSDANILVLEEIQEGKNFLPFYKSHHIGDEELRMLVKWLSHLHRLPLRPEVKTKFANAETRNLLLERLFTTFEEASTAIAVSDSKTYKTSDQQISQIGDEIATVLAFLEERGEVLLHGNFSPGNWINTDLGIYIIDPKYCHIGCAEYDLGILLAHLILASVPLRQEQDIFSYYENTALKESMVLKIAGFEILRVLHMGKVISSATQKADKMQRALHLIHNR